MTLTVMFTTGGKDEIDRRKRALQELWSTLRAWDEKMYRFLRYRSYPALVNWMPFRWQGEVTTLGYRFYRRKLKCS